MTDLPDTRQSLLVRLTQVDREKAWDDFINIYEPTIYRFARSRGLQDADASEVTQQVLIAVSERIEAWDHGEEQGSFRGWLFRVTRNLASKQLRAKRRNLHVDTYCLDEIVIDSDEDASIFSTEYRRQVFRWAANSIRDRYNANTWQAFWRTSVDGESAEQVASELRISVGAVYTAKCRIMTRLRDVVSQLTESEMPNVSGRDDED